LVATGIYLTQIIKNKSTPNPSTWMIWVSINTINTATYFAVVDKNIWIALASLISAVVAVLIFSTSLFKGKFTNLNRIDVVSLVVAIGVGLFWKVSSNAVVSNVALQTVFVISFLPTINGLFIKAARERPVPWVLGTIAYVLQIFIVLLNPVSLWALTFPLVQIIGQGIIALLAFRQDGF